MTASANAHVPVETPQGRVPDFYIVGHPKSGTSALFQMLQAYPQLHLPRKEPSFFVPELRRSDRYAGGIGEYVALFAEAKPDQLIGEATTAYLWSQTAAARIAEVQPQARIIAILREPASFLRSLHMQFMRSDVETESDFRRAIELEPLRAEGKRIPRNSTRPQQLVYSDHVRYVEQLRRYHAVFPRERVLVLIYEDFRSDNEATVRRVLDFLGVDAAASAPVRLVEANHAQAMRSPRAHEFVRSLYLGRESGLVKRSIKAVTPQRARRKAIQTLQEAQLNAPPPPDPELMRELRVRFKGEVEAVSDYLDRDLVSFWGYGELR
jgi:hypothetical protein